MSALPLNEKKNVQCSFQWGNILENFKVERKREREIK
jgi:hypothetical protein